MKLNKYIDHTLLKPQATKAEIELLSKQVSRITFTVLPFAASTTSLISS